MPSKTVALLRLNMAHLLLKLSINNLHACLSTQYQYPKIYRFGTGGPAVLTLKRCAVVNWRKMAERVVCLFDKKIFFENMA
jgi:hypothetical protein